MDAKFNLIFNTSRKRRDPMYKVILILALSFWFLGAHIFELNGEHVPISYSEKYYISFDQLNITPTGIFVFLDANTCLLVPGIYQDAHGFYYLEEEGISWICNWCGALNSFTDSSCYRCNESYGTSPP